MDNTAKFQFYEKVLLPSTEGSVATGFVMGRCQDDNRRWHYSVHVVGTATSCMYCEDDLVSTGEVGSREDFYDGSSIRVTVNGRGEGALATDKAKRLK
jgi:hypothetical protein